MSKAIIARDWEALRQNSEYDSRSDRPGDDLYVRGWVVKKHRRHITAEATLVTDAGDERAHAWGTFLVPV